MSTTTNANVTAIDTFRMGVEEFKTAIAAGHLTQSEGLAILDQRIAARAAKKKPPVANVIRYRNELASAAGKAELPVPQYQAKAKAEAPEMAGCTVDQLADRIAAGGWDIGQVITALATRMQQPSAA